MRARLRKWLGIEADLDAMNDMHIDEVRAHMKSEAEIRQLKHEVQILLDAHEELNNQANLKTEPNGV